MLTAVWILIDVLDSLDNEGISTKLFQPESEDIYMRELRELWMWDISIYAKERRDTLKQVWSFGAERSFHEPLPKFYLPAVIPATDMKSRCKVHVVIRAKDSQENIDLTSNKASLPMGLVTVIDDPFTSESGKTFAVENVIHDTLE